jgi:transcriptional regulator with XRE-family HTH domain
MGSGSAAYAICLLARRHAGLSQRALAEATGVSPSTIARIEKGRMEPTVALITRLVEACGLDLRMSLVEPGRLRRPPARMTVEDRLRENSRLAALAETGRRRLG